MQLMLSKTNRASIGLRGGQFQPPPKPRILRSKARTELADRRGAKNIGRAGAEEFDLSDSEGQYYYEGLIDAEAEGAIADTREAYEVARGNAEKVETDARQQRLDAEPKLFAVIEEDKEDEQVEQERAHLRGLGIVAYVFVLVVAYLAALPQDMAAATGLPLPPGMQLLAALTLGAALMLAAHFAGEKLLELDEARANRAREPGKYQTVKREAVALFATPLAFIVAVAIWRGQTFAAESKAVGGLFASATTANLAFTALALVAFAAAVTAARSYFRKKPLREIRRRRARNRKEKRRLEQIIDINERVEKQALLTLEHLDEQEDKTLAAIEAWRVGRKKKLRHKAGIAQLKHHKKLVHQGLVPPDSRPVPAEPSTRHAAGATAQPVNDDPDSND